MSKWVLIAAFAAAGGYCAALNPALALKAVAVGLANAAPVIPLIIFFAAGR